MAALQRAIAAPKAGRPDPDEPDKTAMAQPAPSSKPFSVVEGVTDVKPARMDLRAAPLPNASSLQLLATAPN